MTTITKNVSDGFLPTVPMDFDCCLVSEKTQDFSKIPLSISLSNILTSTDDLRVASHKVDEVEEMIKEQELKDYSRFYLLEYCYKYISIFNCFLLLLLLLLLLLQRIQDFMV